MRSLAFALPLALLGCATSLKTGTTEPQVAVTSASETPGNKAIGHQLPTPSTISGGMLNDQALELPQPEYPKAARAVHAEGEVVVQVVIDEQGNVLYVSAVSGHHLLRAAAERAAKKAKFAPTMSDGDVRKVVGTVKYSFDRN